MPARPDAPTLVQPVMAGAVSALVGSASTFAVVLAGLRAVGATEAEAASGLLVLCVSMGLLAIVLSVRLRMPINLAWSTPGAALLATATVPPGGWPAAVGAFALAGVLIVAAGLLRPLGRWIAAIPVPIASAMLAGVVLPLCLAPVQAVAEIPLQAGPVVVVWLLLLRVATRWAVPGALAAAGVVIALEGAGTGGAPVAPVLAVTLPTLTPGAVLGIALPLFVVTMASQNVPGMGVLASFGYRPPLRGILVATGTANVLTAPFGAHAINLAAITAALTAGPDAHPDPARRWVATVGGGVSYLVLGLCAGLATALIAASPPLLIEAVAGLALLGALGGALTSALSDAHHREAAVITFVVSASSITVLGIGAAFWGLVAGLVYGFVRPAPAASSSRT